MSNSERRKGRAREQEIVRRHMALGVPAKRVLMSGVSADDGGHDVDIYPFGRDAGALVCEVKAGKQIPTTIVKWLGENDVLFLRPDRLEPLVVVPWTVWARILKALQGDG